ncbi:sigma-70 family RNA polymerase sigma factor [Planctomycetaceae bacterium SH139]
MSNRELSSDSRRLVGEGQVALAELFSQYRERLQRLVEFRLDPRIRGRVDAADVLQEAFLQISKRLDEYRQAPLVSCFVWIRQQTLQTLIDIQRGQFREKRDPQREVQRLSDGDHDGTSIAIANYLIAEMTSPSQAVAKVEEAEQLRRALASMPEMDREVLALRHFELLGNQEVAEVLGISPTAASNRYVRAAAKLGEILQMLDSPSRKGPASRQGPASLEGPASPEGPA